MLNRNGNTRGRTANRSATPRNAANINIRRRTYGSQGTEQATFQTSVHNSPFSKLTARVHFELILFPACWVFRLACITVPVLGIVTNIAIVRIVVCTITRLRCDARQHSPSLVRQLVRPLNFPLFLAFLPRLHTSPTPLRVPRQHVMDVPRLHTSAWAHSMQQHLNIWEVKMDCA